MTVGVLGAGKIAKKHVSSLKKFDEINVKIHDINKSRARGVADELGIEYELDIDNITKSESVDVVDVCTPVRTHKQLILQSLENGKDVFCEKPLCENIEDAYEIKGAAQAKNCVVAVGYLYRFHPAIKEMKRIVDEGVIGEPYFASFRLGARGSHRAWKHKSGQGGGVMNEISVHKVDLANWIFGEAKKVRSKNHMLVLPERNIDGETVQVDACDLLVSDYKSEECDIHLHTDIFTSGFIEFVEVMGTNGSVFSTILDYMPNIVHLNDGRGGYDDGRTVTKYEPVDLFKRQFDDFFRAIKNSSDVLNSVDSSISVLKTLNKVLK